MRSISTVSRKSIQIPILFALVGMTGQAQETDGAMGFFSPEIQEIDVLYIYKDLDRLINPWDAAPMDSITFKKRGYNKVVDTVPEGFKPAIDKLDYGIYYLRVKKIGRDYIEVFLDDKNSKTAFMMRSMGKFVTWGDFLLGMHSIEFNDINMKVYDLPEVNAVGRLIDPAYFRGKFVQGDWMQVDVLASDYHTVVGTGWILWRKNGMLLVHGNLLS